MTASRRSLLAAAGGGLALPPLSATAARPRSGGDAVTHLVWLSEASNAALMAGDIDRYLDLISLTDDFTLMAPFGGEPSRRADYPDERMRAMGRFFRNGVLKMQLVQAYAAPDLVVLALIERANVEVGGLQAQDWDLRVTLVYRRDGGKWRLAHRHADPLAHGVNLEEAAALARGKGA